MSAWRMYYRTLDEESVAYWRAQGVATETAVLNTWIRREAEREGLEPHPTSGPWIETIREGGETMGVCVSIPVRADPDPLHIDDDEPRLPIHELHRPRPDGVPGPALVLAIVGIPLLIILIVALVWR